MTSAATTVEQYLNELPADRKEPMTKLRNEILTNLPKGFQEEMNYGMIGYVVPHSLYSPGYHCDPSKPLPFANIASQKNFIAFYHMGMYMKPDLLQWYQDEYAKSAKGKLDMGKSCQRFKKADQINYSLIGSLMKKISVKDWITMYEDAFKNPSKTK